MVCGRYRDRVVVNCADHAKGLIRFTRRRLFARARKLDRQAPRGASGRRSWAGRRSGHSSSRGETTTGMCVNPEATEAKKRCNPL